MSADLEVSSMEYRLFEERADYKGWAYGCEFEIVKQVLRPLHVELGELAAWHEHTSSFISFFFPLFLVFRTKIK